MKTLKYVILITLLIIGGSILAGCNNSNATNSQEVATVIDQPESQVAEKSIDLKNNNAILDSINTLVYQIKSINEKQNSYESNFEKISKEVKDVKGSSHLFDLISLIISIIALIIAIIALALLKSAQKKADWLYNYTKKLEQNIDYLDQKTNVATANQKHSNSGLSNNDFTTLDLRISIIERQLNSLIKETITGSQKGVPSIPNSEVRQYVDIQRGYFGLPSQMSLTEAYFRRLHDIRDSDSRFEVKIRDNKAEFKPIEGPMYLNDLKSNDAIKLALDIQGCAPSEATQMRVKSPGEAKKDSDRWIIIKKATIELYKETAIQSTMQRVLEMSSM